ncbi:UNVERIFIED_CONTAM: hypothetical protein NCL1_24642 [Trichonephila clavipes]
MERSSVIYGVLICILLPLVSTFDEWSGTQSRLNEKHNSENEMNRASSSQNCVCGRENKKEMEMEIFRDENIVNPPHKYPWVVSIEFKKMEYQVNFKRCKIIFKKVKIIISFLFCCLK